jgi:multidrug efflux pump subunit AcrA (membrane-fusion protein)
VLQASSTVHTVTVALATDLRSTVKEGDRVTVTLPDDTTTPGRVTSIGRVASIPSNNPDGQVSSESGPTVPVHIGLAHPGAAGSLDQTPVQVEITDQTVRNVLAVDVTALLARAGGGYAVEVVDDDGSHHLVPVKPGLFDDAEGLVQVSGSGVRAGQHVVVAGE